jgi:hypothetical protein
MRLSQSGKAVAEAQNYAATMAQLALKAKYERLANEAVRLQCHQYDGIKDFQKVPDEWLLKPWTMIKAFICDYLMHRADLGLELQGLTITQSGAVDHQRKVVKRVRQQSNELEMGTQSFVITTINPNATWCQDIAASTTPTTVNLRRNVYRRRNLGGQVVYFPVSFNTAMHEEWKSIYTSMASHRSSVVGRSDARGQHAERVL